jgi:hypothetical protein
VLGITNMATARNFCYACYIHVVGIRTPVIDIKDRNESVNCIIINLWLVLA